MHDLIVDRLKHCICLLFACIAVGFLAGQQGDRPKVGLVLSGGSAHGIAHVGVLKYLEREGIHIDYITGTSMGSIIGALYATGMSASAIEELTASQNWSELLAINVPLNEMAPSEKEYHNRYAITLELKNGSLSLPQGFLNSQKLDLNLNRMFRAANGITDFNDLPIPFKCVAVDIETGEIVIMDKGYLGNAVRASMAIPSVFTPVQTKDHLLVDGGLRRNFPVQEVIEMGADIVIGVYVGSKLDGADKLNSMIDILSQSAFMMGILDSKEQQKNVDILIEPDVKDLPAFDFDRYQDLINEGFRATRSQKPLLDSIKTLLASYDSPRLSSLYIPQNIAISKVRFPYVEEPFDALAHFKFGNVAFERQREHSFDEIEAGIARVFGTKHYENINYAFKDDAHQGLMMDVLAKPKTTNSFSFGLNYMPTSATSFLITNELRNILTKPSVLYTTLRIAENWGAKLDFKYRLGKKKDFLFTSLLKSERYHQHLYKESDILMRLSEIASVGRIGVGYEPNNVVFLNAYMGLNHFNLKSASVVASDFGRYRRLNTHIGADLSYQTVDAPAFVHSGIDLVSGIRYNHRVSSDVVAGSDNQLFIPDDGSYLQAFLRLNAYHSMSDKWVVRGGMHLGWKSKSSLTDNYRVGGLEDRNTTSIAMIGLETHQIHFQNYAQWSASVRWQVMKSLYLGLTTAYITGDQTYLPSATDSEQAALAFWSYGIESAVSTPLGPLRLAYGRNTYLGEWNTNLTFGYTFF